MEAIMCEDSLNVSYFLCVGEGENLKEMQRQIAEMCRIHT